MAPTNEKGFRLNRIDIWNKNWSKILRKEYKLDKKYYLNNGPIAYYSGLNGIEIYDLNDDYILCTSNAWNNRKNLKWHQVKIYYTIAENPYFIVNGYRIPLNECLRTNF